MSDSRVAIGANARILATAVNCDSVYSALAGPIAQKLYNPRSVRNYHASSDYDVAADCFAHERLSKASLRLAQMA
jgi:hypothetical protein